MSSNESLEQYVKSALKRGRCVTQSKWHSIPLKGVGVTCEFCLKLAGDRYLDVPVL